MTGTSGRLLDLLSLLQARRDWTGPELADRLRVSGRTLRRDVERLRDLGYPVDSLTGPAGGYRLQAGTAMPPLLLDDEEAVAIAVGLGTAARASVTGIEETALRALVKLEQVLPARLRRRVAALASAVVVPSPGGPTVDADHLTTIGSACRDRERLRFRYRSRQGEETSREVEPWALVNYGRHWYLAAWDCGREDWRTFRVDRLERPFQTGLRFSPRSHPSGDPARYVRESIRQAPHRFEARVTLHASAEEIAGRFGAQWGTVEPKGEQRCEYRASDDDIGWLALRIAMLGVEFEVQAPTELREELRALAARLDRGAGSI